MRMREKELKATGCNSAIRAINAYLKWSGLLPRKVGRPLHPPTALVIAPTLLT